MAESHESSDVSRVDIQGVVGMCVVVIGGKGGGDADRMTSRVVYSMCVPI